MWKRIGALFDPKGRSALDRSKTGAALERAYRKELQALRDARCGVADALAAERRLELDASSLGAAAERAASAAASALAVADESGARVQVAREVEALAQQAALLDGTAAIRARRVALEELAERVRERVDRIRTEKLAIAAGYADAKAIGRSGEAVTVSAEDVAGVAAMAERARSAARDAQARSEGVVAASDASIDARLATLRAATPPHEKRVPRTASNARRQLT